MPYNTHSTVLQVEISGVYTTIADLISVTPPTKTMATVDYVPITSATKRRMSTVLDNGPVSFSYAYDPANATHIKLNDLVASGDENNFKVVLPDDDATELVFSAFVSNLTPPEHTAEAGAAIWTGELVIDGAITQS